jgi:hypothetical protein
VRPDVIVDFSVDREGADQRVRKLPGFRKYNNLVLKRGFTSDRSLWEWRQTVAYGRVERRNGSVSCSMPAERSYALELPRRMAGEVAGTGSQWPIERGRDRNPRSSHMRASSGPTEGIGTRN